MVVLVLVVAVMLAVEVQEDKKSNHSNESRWRTRGTARICSSTKANSSKCQLGAAMTIEPVVISSNKSSKKKKGTQHTRRNSN